MKKYSMNQIWGADFETSSVSNLNHPDYNRVHVFLWTLGNVGNHREMYHGFDIESFFRKLDEVDARIVFFHNLKFDGEFILYHFLEKGIEISNVLIPKGNLMSISYKKPNGRMCEFRDTMDKFGRMSLDGMSLVLDPNMRKVVLPDEMKYWEGLIEKGFVPDNQFIQYAIRDTEIVCKAVRSEYEEGRFRLTSSSEAYNTFIEWYNRKHKDDNAFKNDMPTLSLYYDTIFRASYRGGICAVNPKFQGKVVKGVRGYDIKSMYPSIMMNMLLPIGHPLEVSDTVPNTPLYIVRFQCQFKLKSDDYFPFIQLKNSGIYSDTEYLRESTELTTMVMPCVAHKMFMERYDITDDCCYEYWGFQASDTVFREYLQVLARERAKYPKNVDPYRNQVYKDLGNMLYGAFALNPNFERAEPYIDENDILKYELTAEAGEPRYVPMSTFITAYARKMITEAIEANYDNWLYSDTDSIWLLDEPKGLVIGSEPGMWEYETWDSSNPQPYPTGKFIRPKTYVLGDENEEVFKEYDVYGRLISSITCAGMPDRVKETLNFHDVEPGKSFEGKLMSRRVPGGRCLIETDYTIKEY